MTTFFRSSDKSSSIAGDALYAIVDHAKKQLTDRNVNYTWRAGVRVPSTSNKTILWIGLSAKVLEPILSETVKLEVRKEKLSAVHVPSRGHDGAPVKTRIKNRITESSAVGT